MDDGRIIVYSKGRPPLFFSPDECERLAAFAGNKPRIQRYPADGG
ncbi:hypothetical protein [Mycobacterium malmoense]|nr:hypothetical protein [Mycobacterium malmoense]